MERILLYALPTIFVSLCFVVGIELIPRQEECIRENPETCVQTHYKAAVVEYKPIPIGNQTPEETLHSNVRVFIQLIQEAGNQILCLNRGIRNFAFPTAWIDELPFLTAIQSQALWAQSNKANLLASGYHQPDRGSMGSGIYSGDQGALDYVFDASSGTKLVTR
ncbi:Vanin-like protein 1 [Orchesella cincta]|uniref:Vanin-like protein 1 n=1 Tax=Orchesella cincta TaxID=48709 RepID=A0A1D2MQ69_ORCCI|nr:Vanin-like protein 1 [Orchesella cincta]